MSFGLKMASKSTAFPTIFHYFSPRKSATPSLGSLDTLNNITTVEHHEAIKRAVEHAFKSVEKTTDTIDDKHSHVTSHVVAAVHRHIGGVTTDEQHDAIHDAISKAIGDHMFRCSGFPVICALKTASKSTVFRRYSIILHPEKRLFSDREPGHLNIWPWN